MLIKVGFSTKALCLVAFELAFNGNAFGADTGEVGELSGAIGVTLESGSPDVPFYKIAAASLKSEAAFRGQIEGVTDNNVTFYRLPDLLDPTKKASPFAHGMFSTSRARATAVVHDGNVTAIIIDSPGFGYLNPPEVRIHPPNNGTDITADAINATAIAEINGSRVTSITITNGGSGFDANSTPYVEIEGGPHFLRLVEEGDPEEGRFFHITSNSGDQIALANPLDSNLTQILRPNSLVEITPAWTLGSLFGYTSPLIQDGNETTADHIHLRDGNATGYHAYYHDGITWRSVDDPTTDAAETVIYPDEAFIIARRNSSPLHLFFAGAALTVDSFAHLPETNATFLMNNPFGADMMLSDLIAAENLTTDDNITVKWHAHPSDEVADNVELLRNGVWTTYWHDGTNKDVNETARATARAGSGIAGALTPEDISMAWGTITDVTNPLVGENVIVTTDNPHGLRNGFIVTISGVKGYKTDANATHKWRVDENGNKLDNNATPFVIASAANGSYEIVNVTADTFELNDKSGNADYMGGGAWRTGSSGAGYDTNAYVIFIGGGGSGAKGIANVSGGQVTSITLKDGGAGYLSAPKIIINSGGWRRVGSGNSPVNDTLISSGTGIRLVRNHPNGTASRLHIANPIR